MAGSDRRIRVTVIGAGHLGLIHAVCMAELGHEVLAVDTDAAWARLRILTAQQT